VKEREGIFIFPEEFLGARQRLKPITSGAEGVFNRTSSVWKEPPYLHEETLGWAWAHLIEEEIQGGISSQYFKDLSTLFLWISSENWEPMFVEELKRRKISPPFWSKEGKILMYLQSEKVLTLSCLEQEESGGIIIRMLEDNLDILRERGIFQLSRREMYMVKEGIRRELQIKKEV